MEPVLTFENRQQLSSTWQTNSGRFGSKNETQIFDARQEILSPGEQVVSSVDSETELHLDQDEKTSIKHTSFKRGALLSDGEFTLSPNENPRSEAEIEASSKKLQQRNHEIDRDF